MAIYLADNKEYAWLLNSSPHAVTYRPIRTQRKKNYRTAEHLFQSLKFEVYRPPITKCIQSTPNPRETADGFEDDIRPDWLNVRITMMEICLHRKFRNHRQLREKLRSTGDHQIINNIMDPFWGVGADFKGENQFGKALMRLRQKLMKNPNIQAPALPPLLEPIMFSNCESDAYYGFSTFSKHSVKFLDVAYPTAGHLFQAFKFSHRQKIVNQILRSTTAREVRDIATANKKLCRSDWKKIHIPAMRYIIWLKFTQHSDLLVKLILTTGRQLIEDSTDDRLWEWGKDVDGKDQLAKALMRLIRIGPFEPTLPPNPPRKEESVDGCCVMM